MPSPSSLRHSDPMTSTPIGDLLRVPTGPVDLTAYDANGRPGFDGGKKDGAKALPAMAGQLADLQEKLYANAYGDGAQRSVLLVLQGMDTSGKGGVLAHCVGIFNPSGVRIKSFKKPTPEELDRDFLWRVEKEVPPAGVIGIFDRSHYEDVLVVRVHKLAPTEEIERRYGAINAFEKRLVDAGTLVVKGMLHLSYDEQRTRLEARLDDPTKRWKYRPGDVDERRLWPAYQRAYETALERCNTEHAPWHVVPSDRKWYRNWAVGSLLGEALGGMGLEWPTGDFDVATEKARLAAT
jgi:PPK2 family polyphosphate:nucleotide phosphotransferase